VLRRDNSPASLDVRQGYGTKTLARVFCGLEFCRSSRHATLIYPLFPSLRHMSLFQNCLPVYHFTSVVVNQFKKFASRKTRHGLPSGPGATTTFDKPVQLDLRAGRLVNTAEFFP